MIYVWIILGFTFFLAGCQPVENVILRGPDRSVIIDVEVADEPTERAKGLMFRKDLPKGHGMLFVFDEPEVLSFWMKNTVIPLDILFFGGDEQFVSSATMNPCKEDPCPVFSSTGMAKYALEVPVGFLGQYKVNSEWILQAHIE